MYTISSFLTVIKQEFNCTSDWPVTYSYRGNPWDINNYFMGSSMEESLRNTGLWYASL